MSKLSDSWLDEEDFSHLAALEKEMFASRDCMRLMAVMFFDSLGSMKIKDRKTRSRDMGKALVLWLDNEGESDYISSKSELSKPEALKIWVRVALDRELSASCKFEDDGNSKDNLGTASVSKNVGSTSRNRGKTAASNRKSIIMPLRADTGECLFVSTVILYSTMKHHFMHRLLFPILGPVARDPASYTYPKKSPVFASSVEQSTLSEQGAHNNTSWWSRYFNCFRQEAQSSKGRGTATTCHDEQQNIDYAKPGESQCEDVCLVLGGGEDGVGREISSLPPVPQRTPFELKYLQVRSNLHHLIFTLVSRLQFLSSSFPETIQTVFEILREVTIDSGRKEHSAAVSSSNGNVIVTEPVTSPIEDVAEFQRKFRYGTFFTCCSALLFLRLISRAIISPTEHGVIGGGTSSNPKDSSSNRDASGSNSSSIAVASNVQRQGKLAAVALFAHGVAPSGDAIVPVTGNFSPSTSDIGDDDQIELDFTLKIQNLTTAVKDVVSIDMANAIASTLVNSFPPAQPLSETEGKWHPSYFSASSRVARFGAATATNGNECIDNETDAVGLLGSNTDESNDVRTKVQTADAELDFISSWSLASNPTTVWALAELASTVQKVANISCLPHNEMKDLAEDGLIRQLVSGGILDKENADTHIFDVSEQQYIDDQVHLATEIKSVYAQVGQLGSSCEYNDTLIL